MLFFEYLMEEKFISSRGRWQNYYISICGFVKLYKNNN